MQKTLDKLKELFQNPQELTKENFPKIKEALIEAISSETNGVVVLSVLNNLFETPMLALNCFDGTKKQRDEAFINTIKQFDFFTKNIKFIEGSLRELCKFDKLFLDEEGKGVFFIINRIGKTTQIYQSLIKKKRDEVNLTPFQRGIAGTQSTQPHKMLSPINSNQFLVTNEAKEVGENLKKQFIDNPDEIASMFSIITLLGKDAFMVKNEDERKRRDALFDASEFYNASKEVDLKHIYQSFKIQIASYFLPTILPNYQHLFGFKKQISKEKLAQSIDDIMQNIFEITISTNPKFYNGPFQTRTWFGQVPILEKTRKGKGKTHPAFQNEEDNLKILENFKGKLPPIYS